jgi:hypothetical protein
MKHTSKAIAICLMFISAGLFAQEGRTFFQLLDANVPRKRMLYEDAEGIVYNVGDSITFLSPVKGKTYTHVCSTTSIGGMETPCKAAGIELKGKTFTIDTAFMPQSKYPDPFVLVVGVRVKGALSVDDVYYIDIADAVKLKEVKAADMTSEQAQAALKDAEREFSIGILNAKQYEQRKTRLNRYIK